MGFTDPPPRPDYAHYSDQPRDLELWMRFMLPVVAFASKFVVPSSWLDFGAGGGESLLALARQGIRGVGVEVDQSAVALARSRGLTVVDDVDRLESDAAFDVVSVSNVLEHLRDPIKTLSLLGDVIRPDGVIVVGQPNPAGLLPTLWPTGWSGWVPDEHVWHFTLKSMKSTLEAAGLSVVGTKMHSLYHPWTLSKAFPAHAIARVGWLVRKGDFFFMAARRRTAS